MTPNSSEHKIKSLIASTYDIVKTQLVPETSLAFDKVLMPAWIQVRDEVVSKIQVSLRAEIIP
jgi:hypothetical protein